MTTIATDGKTIASDSAVSGDYQAKCNKLFKVKESIIGTCGDQALGLLFVEWYKDKRKEKPVLTDDFEALVLTKRGVEYWGSSLMPIPQTEQNVAIGTGSQFAIGAMDAGKSPIEAVRIACKPFSFSILVSP